MVIYQGMRDQWRMERSIFELSVGKDATQSSKRETGEVSK